MVPPWGIDVMLWFKSFVDSPGMVILPKPIPANAAPISALTLSILFIFAPRFLLGNAYVDALERRAG
jgi:hypothetical protein